MKKIREWLKNWFDVMFGAGDFECIEGEIKADEEEIQRLKKESEQWEKENIS